MVRAWINAPSSFQPCHAYHGRRVVVDEIDGPGKALAVFVDVPNEWQFVDKQVLSHGWSSQHRDFQTHTRGPIA